mmetsp:Transcript_21629/g.50887  ORF Transcript_21629/g.50887 Transcript_21629/m.50887 type:complete len:809 (-) Transcript_21629:353-2779(-)
MSENHCNATRAKRVQRAPTRFVAAPSKQGLTLNEIDRPQTEKNSAARQQKKKQSSSSIQHKKSPRRPRRSSKSAASDEDGKTKLKPRFEIGEPVLAAWWPENMRFASTPTWYPGTITACKEVDEGGQYGPSRFYDVTYDDGDQAECVEDAFVFGKEDYQLEMEGQRWKGISHVVDQKSTDLWAKITGWYSVATVDSGKKNYGRLSEALRAYDHSVINSLGDKVKKIDLNLPQEHPGLFRKSRKGGNTKRKDGEAPAVVTKKKMKEDILEMLREGSRVHVLCSKNWREERLFKATVKEVLADSRQVIIHYDGKKATSVDTIAIELIDSFIGDETDPPLSAPSTKLSKQKPKAAPVVRSSAMVDGFEPSSDDPNQVLISGENLSLLAKLVQPPIKELSVEYNRVLHDALQLYKAENLRTQKQPRSNNQPRPGASTAEAVPMAVPSNEGIGDAGDGYSLATTIEFSPSDDTTIATSSVASEKVPSRRSRKEKKAPVKQKRSRICERNEQDVCLSLEDENYRTAMYGLFNQLGLKKGDEPPQTERARELLKTLRRGNARLLKQAVRGRGVDRRFASASYVEADDAYAIEKIQNDCRSRNELQSDWMHKRDMICESSRKRKEAGPFQGRERRVKVVVSGQAVGRGLVCQMSDIRDAIPLTVVFESPAKTSGKGEGETAGNLAALSTEPHSGLAITSAQKEAETQITARPGMRTLMRPPGLTLSRHRSHEPTKTEKGEGETADNLATLSTKSNALGLATTSAHKEAGIPLMACPRPPGLGVSGPRSQEQEVYSEWMAAVTRACAEEAVKFVTQN